MTDPSIDQDWLEVDRLIKKIQAFRGKVAKLDSTEFLGLIQTWEALLVKFQKLDLYASLLEATNIGEAKIVRFKKGIEEKLVDRQRQILFIETELATMPENQWQKHLTSPKLKAYNKFIDRLSQQAKHTLSEESESILALKNQTGAGALTHLYSIVSETIIFKWQKQALTLEELMAKFHEPSPTVRRQAAKVLAKGLKANRQLIAPLLNSLVQDKAINDQLRGFKLPSEARLLSDDVELSMVEALVKSVKAHQNTVNRYYKLKKQILKVKKLYWWDRYAPLPATKAKISQNQAIEMVQNALTEFSPAMAEISASLIKRQHIDWLPANNKRAGAFCAYAGADCYPFVMLNYTQQPRDVMTLAHELGHAIHGQLANQHNSYLQADSSLALAEIASVFAETLLFKKLLQSKELTKNDKVSLLMSFIEDRFATVFRQISMFQFEQKLHQRRGEVGELSADEIDQLWDQTMRQPFESSLTYTNEHAPTWMYVSHIFHWPFYVYSYGFAQICVLALYKQFQTQGEDFIEPYLALLKAGGSLSPKDNLKRMGLDLEQPAFWSDGLGVLDDFIDQLEKEIKS